MIFLHFFFSFSFSVIAWNSKFICIRFIDRKVEKDTKFKGTIKYVLFFYRFTGTLCISLTFTQSPRYQSLTLEGTLCFISTPGWSLVPPGLYSTEEGYPSWFLLVPSDWGIGASPLETDQDSCPGWLPRVPLDSCLPLEGFFLVPLPLDLSASLLPVSFFVFSVWYTAYNL